MLRARHIQGLIMGLFLWGTVGLARLGGEDLAINVTIMIPIPVDVVITFQPLGHSLAGNLLLPIITTDPPGLPYITTYTDLTRGGPATTVRPTQPGTYLVTVTVIAPGYQGSSSQTVVIPGPSSTNNAAADDGSESSSSKCGLGGAIGFLGLIAMLMARSVFGYAGGREPVPPIHQPPPDARRPREDEQY